jgi:hypothetical protein
VLPQRSLGLALARFDYCLEQLLTDPRWSNARQDSVLHLYWKFFPEAEIRTLATCRDRSLSTHSCHCLGSDAIELRFSIVNPILILLQRKWRVPKFDSAPRGDPNLQLAYHAFTTSLMCLLLPVPSAVASRLQYSNLICPFLPKSLIS